MPKETKDEGADAEAAQEALREGLVRARKLLREARRAIALKKPSPPPPRS